MTTDPAPYLLLIEDDEDVAEVLQVAIEDAGARVLRAKHGGEALELLARTEQKPAMILLDLMMPVVNGWLFRSKQLQDPALAEIPVALLTASRTDVLPGVAGVLSKPISLFDLLSFVSRTAPSLGVRVPAAPPEPLGVLRAFDDGPITSDLPVRPSGEAPPPKRTASGNGS